MPRADGPIVILGASGQDGQYLARHHRERGERVLCFSRSGSPDVERLDVSDGKAVADLVRAERPRIVYQLAAVSTTRHDALWANHAAIATGTLNVLEAVWNHSQESRVVVVGSAVQFENHGLPIRETDPFEARSAYAVARIHAAYAARFFRGLGLKVYVAYLFHHESPLRSTSHVSARICNDVAAIALGKATILEVGDLSVEKEWGYAGDVAEAMAILASQDDVFEVVVGTGQAYSIEAWVKRCFAEVGLNPEGLVHQTEGFRPEYKRILSCPDTLRSLNWIPKVDFDGLAVRMMQRAMMVAGG